MMDRVYIGLVLRLKEQVRAMGWTRSGEMRVRERGDLERGVISLTLISPLRLQRRDLALSLKSAFMTSNHNCA